MLKMRDLVCKNPGCNREGQIVRDVMVEVMAEMEVAEICKFCRKELAHALSPTRYLRGGNGNEASAKPPTETGEARECCSDMHHLDINIAPVAQNKRGVVGKIIEHESGKVVGLVHESGQFGISTQAFIDKAERDHAKEVKSKN